MIPFQWPCRIVGAARGGAKKAVDRSSTRPSCRAGIGNIARIVTNCIGWLARTISKRAIVVPREDEDDDQRVVSQKAIRCARVARCTGGRFELEASSHDLERLLELASPVPEVHYTSDAHAEGCDRLWIAIEREPRRILVNVPARARSERTVETIWAEVSLRRAEARWVERGIVSVALGAQCPSVGDDCPEIRADDADVKTLRSPLTGRRVARHEQRFGERCYARRTAKLRSPHATDRIVDNDKKVDCGGRRRGCVCAPCIAGDGGRDGRARSKDYPESHGADHWVLLWYTLNPTPAGIAIMSWYKMNVFSMYDVGLPSGAFGFLNSFR